MWWKTAERAMTFNLSTYQLNHSCAVDIFFEYSRGSRGWEENHVLMKKSQFYVLTAFLSLQGAWCDLSESGLGSPHHQPPAPFKDLFWCQMAKQRLTKQTMRKVCVYSHRKYPIIFYEHVFCMGNSSSRFQSITINQLLLYLFIWGSWCLLLNKWEEKHDLTNVDSSNQGHLIRLKSNSGVFQPEPYVNKCGWVNEWHLKKTTM